MHGCACVIVIFIYVAQTAEISGEPGTIMQRSKSRANDLEESAADEKTGKQISGFKAFISSCFFVSVLCIFLYGACAKLWSVFFACVALLVWLGLPAVLKLLALLAL